jgi:DNA modification methylase
MQKIYKRYKTKKEESFMERLNVEYVNIDALVPHPKNCHDHSDDQIDRLCSIIKYQSFRNPVTVQKGTNLIVCGHGRTIAAKKLGMEKVPVIYQEFESDAQLYAHLVADNAIGKDTWASLDLGKINMDILDLGPDLDIEMLGLKDFEVEPLDRLDPQTDEDAVPEVEHAITRRGDVWLLGNHRVMCGDSTMIDDVERLMNGEKADMVFTDPPYSDGHAAMGVNNIQKQKEIRAKGGSFDASLKIKNDDNLDIMPEVAANLDIISKPKAPKIVFFKWKKWEEIKEHWGVFGEPSSCCVWDRAEMAAATFIFNPCHEFAFFWGSLAAKKNTSAMSNVWRCKKERENKTLHPTVKPIEICENAIDGACEKRGLVADAFLGSGSTLIACEKTNRKCYGMELDEKYCDVIVKRWEEYTGSKATLESSGQTYLELKEVRDGATS